MPPPKYKLTYFPTAAGRGEFVRLVFAAAKVEYEDVRIQPRDWPKLKPSTPFGQIPILEFDGHVLSQTLVISSYLAREFGLAGKTSLDAAKCDMIASCVEDMGKPVLAAWKEKDEEKKAKMKKKVETEELPAFLNYFERLAGENGHFVGDKLSWADIAFYQGLAWPKWIGLVTDLSKSPKLAKVVEAVEADPGIAAWLERRPQSVTQSHRDSIGHQL